MDHQSFTNCSEDLVRELLYLVDQLKVIRLIVFEVEHLVVQSKKTSKSYSSHKKLSKFRPVRPNPPKTGVFVRISSKNKDYVFKTGYLFSSKSTLNRFLNSKILHIYLTRL